MESCRPIEQQAIPRKAEFRTKSFGKKEGAQRVVDTKTEMNEALGRHQSTFLLRNVITESRGPINVAVGSTKCERERGLEQKNTWIYRK